MAKLKGALPKAAFEPIGQSFSVEERNHLRHKIRQSDLPFFDKLAAEKALYKLLDDATIPQQAEIAKLEKIFGPKLAKALLAKQDVSKKVMRNVLDVAGVPISLVASFDLSGVGRQGWRVAVTRPGIWGKAYSAQWQAFFSEDAARRIDLAYRTGPRADLQQVAGLDLTEYGGEAVEIEKRPERFASRLAQKIPWVKMSERAHVVGLNQLRSNYFNKIADQWEGTNKSLQDYKDLANYINIITGRGNLGALQKYAPIMNAAFFSPRFVASTIQAPLQVFSKNKNIRKIAAADLVGYLGVGLTLLAVAKMAGHPAEDDPTSSDFGKIRIGNTRIDVWAGSLPLMRLVSRLIMGKIKTQAGDDIKYTEPFKDRVKEISRFLQMKLSPAAGLAVDVWKGQTAIGEDMTLEDATVREQMYNRLTPLFIQDVLDAAKYQGFFESMAIAPLAWHGIGVQSYPVSPGSQAKMIKNDVSLEVFGKKWDELGPDAQKVLREYRPQIKDVEAQAKFDRTGTPFLQKALKEQQKAADFITKRLPKQTRKQLDLDLIKLSGISRKVGNNWYLTDDKYNHYKNQVSKYLNKVLPDLLRHPTYQELTTDVRREFVGYIYDEIKKAVRQEIIDNASYKDVVSLKKMRPLSKKK
jgi:hypothetical protein